MERTEEELSDKRIESIKDGIRQAHAGQTRPAREVFAELGLDLDDEA